MGLLFVFIDGVGIGPRAGNPLRQNGARVLGFDAETYPAYNHAGGLLRAIDANLGVEGIPQSATGQTAIFSGINAPAAIGTHLSGTPNTALREILRRQSIFISLKQAGLSVTFANAFTPAYFLLPLRRISASSQHLLGAGVPPRWVWHISRREALFQDFTNQTLIDAGFDLPFFGPADAADTLINLTEQHDFVLYEYFLTDAAAHGRITQTPAEIIPMLDAMLAALLERIDLSRHAVLICSDHGNLEDSSTRSHTRNPVPYIAWGRDKELLADGVQAITDIRGAVCRWFGVQSDHGN